MTYSGACACVGVHSLHAHFLKIIHICGVAGQCQTYCFFSITVCLCPSEVLNGYWPSEQEKADWFLFRGRNREGLNHVKE